jgi:hypothetical protein
MKLRVYIAAAARELDRAKRMIAAARALGTVEITRDWTPDIDAAQAAGKRDADYSGEERRTFAAADLFAVRTAHVVWLLAPEEGGRGSWVEFGYALGSAPHASTIVSGPFARHSIFTELAHHVVQTDDEALRVLSALAGLRLINTKAEVEIAK